MNFSRQALLGIGMIIGGSIMLYAMVQQISASDEQASAPAIVERAEIAPATATPLTTDVETETRLLAQKQQERAARVAAQEQRAEQFLTEQESAEAQALAKARAENQRYIENTTPAIDNDDTSIATQPVIATPKVQPRVDQIEAPVAPKPSARTTVNTTNDEAQKAAQAKQAAVKNSAEEAAQKTAQLKKQADADLAATKKAAQKEADAQKKAKQKAEDDKKVAEVAKTEPPKAPTDYKVKSGDGLIKLAREYNVPVAALAQANNTSPSASLQLGQTIVIPSRKQIQRLEREAKEAEQARAAEKAKAEISAKARSEAQQKLREARKEVKETDAKGSFGVQVSLASNQAKADEVAKKFKAAGYEVKTSATSRGVRVVVGPERGKIAALALKDKVNSDPKVDTTGAWVLYW